MAIKLEIDGGMVSRLLLGALTESEQRQLVARLLRTDAEMRAQLAAVLQPFEMFDVESLAAYAEALDSAPDSSDQSSAETRRRLLADADQRAGDIEALVRGFTVGDALQLGGVSRQLFTWTTAEHLLARAQEPDTDDRSARTSCYLASTVIDIVDILGLAGHSPHFPAVIDDVRRRIGRARARLAGDDGPDDTAPDAPTSQE